MLSVSVIWCNIEALNKIVLQNDQEEELELEEVPTSNDSLSEMRGGGGVSACPEIGGYIEQRSGFRGVFKAGKAREKPAKSPRKGGSEMLAVLR